MWSNSSYNLWDLILKNCENYQLSCLMYDTFYPVTAWSGGRDAEGVPWETRGIRALPWAPPCFRYHFSTIQEKLAQSWGEYWDIFCTFFGWGVKGLLWDMSTFVVSSPLSDAINSYHPGKVDTKVLNNNEGVRSSRPFGLDPCARRARIRRVWLIMIKTQRVC